MFSIGYRTGFELYLAFMLVAFAAAAAYEFWRAQVHSWGLSEERLCRCSDCKLTFVVRRRENVARCPRCQKLCTVR